MTTRSTLVDGQPEDKDAPQGKDIYLIVEIYDEETLEILKKEVYIEKVKQNVRDAVTVIGFLAFLLPLL